MIRRTIESEADLDGIVTEVMAREQFIFQQSYDEALVELEPELYISLNETPPKRTGTWGGWSTDPKKDAKARRWWFWQLSKKNIPTDGKHYQRQGNVAQAFELLSEQLENNVNRIRIRMTAGWLRYLVGTLDRRRGASYQIPGHKQTGWWRILDKLDEWETQLIERILEKYDDANIRSRNR